MDIQDKFNLRKFFQPDTIASKCRLRFGFTIILVLILALLFPYLWMGKLAQKSVIDSGFSAVETVLKNHMKSRSSFELDTEPFILEETGDKYKSQYSPVNIRWRRFELENQPESETVFSKKELKTITEIREEDKQPFRVWGEGSGALATKKYVHLIKSESRCLQCHSEQGAAPPFQNNQPIGAFVITKLVGHTDRARLVNIICILMAGLLAGSGAIIALYVTVQKVILSPLRQLRALANNLAEGNLDTRTSIKTNDEYERLSNAINHMLDGLQSSQEKLRNANRQLDEKILELSERNVELFKANKLKGEFLANMSHEFRTPLNSIMGFADIIRERPDAQKEKIQRYADNIGKSGRNLLSMINDLLEMAKVEAGKVEIKIHEVNIPEICSSLVNFFLPMTTKKSIYVDIDLDPEIPIIRTDPDKLQQILYNFMSNAVKFVPESGKVSVIGRLLNEKTVRLSIADNGPGISKNNLDKIFDKFRQLDGSITRTGTGTGLGLAISKELSVLLGAEIKVESVLNQGAVFSLDLPVLGPDAKMPETAKDNQQ
ncbi:Non-motile and phage-resistance protein [Limihaloglobus sulfuriphilus]|uniref:histidine kinase n=1 Tax=Limihaloglobus sulfuriphilus TaxID=1851148 RepID=A0A1Q2MBF2_9BACT|nr:HAMP domain-containing sensor histidine kinase [Limihaloglobus sulfuriphilus]AQQ70026.1 Non-motile and phage-resistance protein [Limihaloglobus sulfuriphilus]